MCVSESWDCDFWKEVAQLKKSKIGSENYRSPTIDGVSAKQDIADLFASKYPVFSIHHIIKVRLRVSLLM